MEEADAPVLVVRLLQPKGQSSSSERRYYLVAGSVLGGRFNRSMEGFCFMADAKEWQKASSPQVPSHDNICRSRLFWAADMTPARWMLCSAAVPLGCCC